MTGRRIAGVFGFVLFTAALPAGAQDGEAAQPKCRSGTVLYKAKASATASQRGALDRALRVNGLKKSRGLVHGAIVQASTAAHGSEEEMAEALKATGAVEFAEPDYLVRTEGVPNDPQYAQQWHHPKINSPAAWDVTTGSASVVVAVIDTGVEATHPELAANMALPGYNTTDNGSNAGPAPTSNGWHGTFVSGLIAAVGNNGAGIAGMGWKVKIMPIQVMYPDGTAYISDLAEGIIWAADHGAKVCNLSMITRGSYSIDSAATYLRGKGGLLFAAAENDGIDPGYPDFASYVTVGATDANDAKTSFSNYGNFIDIVAPGINMRSTYTGGSYATGYGTSFSTPVAAGLAALIWSINPGFTPAQVEGFIFNTCKDLGTAGNDSVYGYGRIDAAAAVQMAQAFVGNFAPSIDSAPWANPNSITLGNTTTVNVIASDPDSGPSALTYTWSKVSGPGTVSFSPNGTTGAASSTASLSAAGTYVVRVTVSDGADTVIGDTDVVVTDPSVINPPSNLTGTVSGSTVTLRWTDNSSNETGFQIDRGVKVRKTTTWTTNVATVGANATSFSQTVSNGTYLYRVRAFNSSTGKVSANSNEVQVKVGTTGGGGKGKSR